MERKILTTAAGAPVADDHNSISAGRHGPLTFDNFRLFEKLAHFNRERIPERVVHARGTGAYGTFILEKDLSKYTIADFLRKHGKETQVFVRFSTVGGGQDSSDYARDPRGFAVKFYTRFGNFDMVGNNTPVFFLNDPSKFPDFVHSQKKNPRTNLPDPAAIYEFWANHPQSLHQHTILMSDRGIPYSYRHMHGFSSHTLSFWNQAGERFWVKWHLKTNQGIKNVTNTEAASMDPAGAQRDLVDAIDRGDFPTWSVELQIMPGEDARQYRINPFDLTKIWPYDDYPLIPIGSLELNANVENYFSETEQSTFAPSNLVPGIGASPDKMLQARLLAYQDAHRYRVGANSHLLPVNQPQCPVRNYQRDGLMSSEANNPPGANFYPNDRENEGAPQAALEFAEPPMPLEPEAAVQAYSQDHDDYYSQAGDLFRLMSEEQKDQLAGNIAEGLVHASESVQKRMLAQYCKADPNYSNRVYLALKALREET